MKPFLLKYVKKQRLSYYLLYVAAILAVIGIDQATKFLAVEFLKPVDTVPIIEGVIHLTYATNKGAAFGMLADAPWVFNTVTIIMLLVLSAYLFLGNAENKLYGIAISMIIGGGIGNMIDRTALGYVVDFIDFRLINFAIFNGADSFVCVGAGLLILAMVIDITKEYKGASKEGDAK